MTTPSDPEFAARRTAARARLNAMDGALGGTIGDRNILFNEVYRLAQGDAAAVPWAELAPRELLVEWANTVPHHTGDAIDIGCGLGDNAQFLREIGYQVSAFDISPVAITWAQRRFPEKMIDFRQADLFDLPVEWLGAFDLVHETYTVQAMVGDQRARALRAIAGLVAPGGRLLVITRGRDDDADPDGPPWPISRAELKMLEELGLFIEKFDDLTHRDIRHFRITYCRS
ncbi:MAG: class I SAM-dependent methyltransferase [Alphaproteobacteria bacterium]